LQIPFKQLDIFHGVKYITLDQDQQYQLSSVLLANKDSNSIPQEPQLHPQQVNSVFHALQHSPLLVHLSEHGLDITSIQPLPSELGLLVHQMLPHVCIHHQVLSQHHVQQDIIYNNN